MDRTRPTGSAVLPLEVGDVVRLRRRHPCGGDAWRVTRTGADIGVSCTTCGRRVLVDRRALERRVVDVAHPAPDEGVGA
jgi:hypothetical protein